jgi:hypothetical protein
MKASDWTAALRERHSAKPEKEVEVPDTSAIIENVEFAIFNVQTTYGIEKKKKGFTG